MARKLFLSGVSLSLIGTAACGAAVQNNSVDLRGYGKVTAAFSNGEVKFSCQDETHADYVLGKIQADLFWNNPMGQATTQATVGGKQVPVYVLQPYGALLLYRSGADVIALGADDLNTLSSQAAAELAASGGSAVFTPTHAYPKFLDSYDLRAVKFLDASMWNLDGANIDEQWNFATKFGTGMAVQSACFFMASPAAGIAEWGPTDYMLDAAAKTNSMLTLEVSPAGSLPLWAYNRVGSRAEPTPTTLMDGQGRVGGASANFQTFGQSPADKESGFEYLDAVVKRYGPNPNVGPWMLWTGEPGQELAFHDRTTMFLDYSAPGQEAFRAWLRDSRGLSLNALGQRWYGNPNQFSDWSQVFLPDVNAFFGDPGDKDSLPLGGTWEWQAAPPGSPQASASGSGEPSLPEGAWVSFEDPPSQDGSLIPMGHAFYRKKFTADGTHAGKANYLVVDAYIQSPQPVSVWLNGQFVGQAVTGYNNPDIAINVSGKVVAGENRVVIEAPAGGNPASEGKIIGPVFFTDKQPRRYPQLGPQGNARFIDLKDWQVHAMFLTTESYFSQLRALDPDRPAILSGGMFFDTGDLDAQLCSTLNLGLENTGREVNGNRPWDPGLGIVNGFYGTSEESRTTDTPQLDQELGRMLYDGDSAHLFYRYVNTYIKLENSSQWFSRNANSIRLIGKAMRHKPPIALFFNTASNRYGLGGAVDDIGSQGTLSRGHFDYGFASNWSLSQDKINQFPYLIDIGSVELDPATIQQITQYVQQGGVFIATATTGRHGPIEPNSWPISQLTGFSVAGDNAGGPVTFVKQLAIANSLAGDPVSVNRKGGLSLRPNADGCQTLATWSDGSTAIGYRTLGKGRVIVIGVPGLGNANISRQGGQGSFISSFLEALGVGKNTDAGSGDVWTRNFTTKNGLQEWLVAYNSSNSATSADVKLRADSQPAGVTDLVTGQDVQASYSGGWVTISGVSFDPHGVHVFAMRRASMVQALGAWWQEKLDYWTKSSTPTPATLEPPTRIDTIEISDWKYAPDQQGSLTKADNWRQPQFDDSNWPKISTSPWTKLSSDLHAYRGGMVYRGAVTIPADWADREILVNMYAFDNPVVMGQAKVSLDGQPIGTYAPRFGLSQLVKFEVSKIATPGQHVLSISVDHDSDLDTLAGPYISGPVWLSVGPRFTGDTVKLTDWQGTGADWKPSGSLRVPGNADVKYVSSTFTAPQSWQGQTVMLAFDSSSKSVAIVNINGHLIGVNGYVHAFGNVTWINLTPYLKLGQPNRIQLWPLKPTLNYGNQPQNQTQAIQLARATVGAVDPRDLPIVQQ